MHKINIEVDDHGSVDQNRFLQFQFVKKCCYAKYYCLIHYFQQNTNTQEASTTASVIRTAWKVLVK